jgi:antitoxin MazE
MSRRVYLETAMQVSKWGNSLAVRLPAAVVEGLALAEGDDIEVHVRAARRMEIARTADRDELMRDCAPSAGVGRPTSSSTATRPMAGSFVGRDVSGRFKRA